MRRFRVAVFRLGSLRGWNRRLLVAYMAAIAMTLTVLVMPLRPADRGGAIPAWASGSRDRAEGWVDAVQQWVGRWLDTDRARRLLQQGVPWLAPRGEAPADARESGSGFSLRTLVDAGLYWGASIRLSEPGTLLRSGLAVLAVAPEEPPVASGGSFLPGTEEGLFDPSGGAAVPGSGGPSAGETEETDPQAKPEPVEWIPPDVYGSGPPVVGIYHTHSRESFLPELARGTRSAYTSDQGKNIVRVGQELARVLAQEYGIAVVHSRVAHDRNGLPRAYGASLETAKRMLAEYPSIKILLDVHRDSQGAEATTAQIGGQRAARVMLVVGTDQRLPHPNWQKNQAFAFDIVRAMAARYPELPIGVYRKAFRFNQHLTPGAILVEIGGPGNTIEEELRTARLMAEVIAEIVRSGKYPR